MMFRLGISTLKPFTATRALRPLLSAGFVKPSFSQVNVVGKTASGTRAFTNWRNVANSGFNRSSSSSLLNKKTQQLQSLQPLIQKRLATFRDLGRNTYGRSSGPNYNNVQNNIIKPLIFVTIFSLATYFAMPYLFTYTPMAAFKKNPQNLIYTIIGMNVIIFGLWQIRYSNAFLYKTLERFFVMDRSALSRTTNWSLILSSFSHQEPFHLFVNMLCLYSFSGSMVSVLGITGFSSLYLIAGAWASFFSLAYSQLFRHFGRSLGASGSISGVFTAFATIFPNAGIAFFFIPIPGGAQVAAGLFAVYNVAGCLLRWGNFDYAAHLGGMLIGFLWGLGLKKKAERDEAERRNRLRRLGF